MIIKCLVLSTFYFTYFDKYDRIKTIGDIQMLDKILNFEGVIYTNSAIKNKLLKIISEKKMLMKFKFISREDLISCFLGSFDEKYIVDQLRAKDIKEMNNMKIKLESALLFDESYEEPNNKISELLSYRKHLKNINNINNLINNKKVLFINYYQDDDHINLIIGKMKEASIDYELIYLTKDINAMDITYYETQKLEVKEMFEKMCNLIHKGVELSKIYVYYGDSKYLNVLKENSNLYGIPFDYNVSSSLFEYPSVKKLLNNMVKAVKNNNNMLIDDYAVPSYLLNDVTNFAVSEINKLIGNGYFIKDVISYLEYVFRNKKISLNSISPSINVNRVSVINDYNQLLADDEYLFILGLNQNHIPTIIKDDKFVSDVERDMINIPTTSIKNKECKKSFIDLIKRTKNVFASYALVSSTDKLIPSSIINDLKGSFKVNIIKYEYNLETINVYSKKATQVDFNKEYENYIKYNIISDKVKDLKKGFDYKTYKYKYDLGLYSDGLSEKVLENRSLSYTTITDFFKCPYAYYLKYILKINGIETEFDDDRSLLIGNLFHYCLQHLLEMYKDGQDILNVDEFIDEKIGEYYSNNNISLTNELKLFNKIYKGYIIKIYDFILKSMSNSEFKIESLENKYSVPLKDDFVLTGRIDKVLTYTEDDKEYKLVVDYKTGDTKFNLNKIIYGLDLQVLIYFKLLGGPEKVCFGGGYLNRVLPKNILEYNSKKSVSTQLEELYKLDGYTNDKLSIIFKIDKDAANKSYVKGITFKDGTLKAKNNVDIISDEMYASLMKIVDEKLDEIIDRLKQCDFSINPTNAGDLPCMYCSYKELCYKKQNDVEKKDVAKDLSEIIENDKKEEE